MLPVETAVPEKIKIAAYENGNGCQPLQNVLLFNYLN